MRAYAAPVVGIALVALGVAGQWLGLSAVAGYAVVLLVSGLFVLGAVALRVTFYRTGTTWPAISNEPRPLTIGWLDYLKAAICWAYAFEHTYVVEPRLYYLGSEYDRDAPLLVTANYHLTVFLIARRARRFDARLLVVDSDGINVWCSAGKGRFSNAAIAEQLARYDRDLLTTGKWLTLILPKFGFSGVDLRALRDEGIRPVIGPLYAKDLDAYLANPPLKDRDDDRVHFGLQMRLFSWLPGLFQFLLYALAVATLWIAVARPTNPTGPLAVVVLTAAIATAYPVLFPWLPGTRFAVKGLWLGALTTVGLGGLTWSGALTSAQLVAAGLFAFAMALFMGLSYTGNSAVSNYTRVRKEIARFLPLNVVLAAATLVALFFAGGPP